MKQGEKLGKIQFLLGHKNLKVAEIYTHVTSKAIQGIKSHLDRLNIENKNQDEKC